MLWGIIHCREQEIRIDLKDDNSSKEEELGYLMIKLKTESGMTSSTAQKEKIQKTAQVLVSS